MTGRSTGGQRATLLASAHVPVITVISSEFQQRLARRQASALEELRALLTWFKRYTRVIEAVEVAAPAEVEAVELVTRNLRQLKHELGLRWITGELGL